MSSSQEQHAFLAYQNMYLAHQIAQMEHHMRLVQLFAIIGAPPGLERSQNSALQSDLDHSTPCSLPAYAPGELLHKEMHNPYDCDNISNVSTTDYCSEKAEDLQGDLDADDEQASAKTSLPSLGSADHHSGLCSPCAYFHRAGSCSDGLECSFCHLCPPGSIELKRKMKRKLVKAMKNPTKIACQ